MSGRTFVVRRGTTALPNRTVYDERLSYASLGLLAVLLARPDGAPSGYRDLQGRGLGQDATLKALRELDEAGYRHLWRRSGARGRIVTDVIVSEDPMTDDEARARLEERAGQAGLWAVSSGSTVRGIPPHGVTSTKAASAQVAPRGASPWHGQPGSGQAPHNPSGSNGSHFVPSSDRHQARQECPHGEARGASYCPLCRRGIDLPPEQGAQVLDFKLRQAGEHPDDDEEDA